MHKLVMMIFFLKTVSLYFRTEMKNVQSLGDPGSRPETSHQPDAASKDRARNPFAMPQDTRRSDAHR